MIFIQKMLVAVMTDLCSMFLFWPCFCETVSGWYRTYSPPDDLGSENSRWACPFAHDPVTGWVLLCGPMWWVRAGVGPHLLVCRGHWDLGIGWWHVGAGRGPTSLASCTALWWVTYVWYLCPREVNGIVLSMFACSLPCPAGPRYESRESWVS